MIRASIFCFTISLLFSLALRKAYARTNNFNSECVALERSMDSLKNSYSDDSSPSKFKFSQLIVPSASIIIGSLPLYVNDAKELDADISRSISSGHGKLTFDDYLQYSPAVVMWGLDAFSSMRPCHKFKQQTTILALSAIASLAIVRCTKTFVGRARPDTGATNSFPSGHTATAFLCAEMLHQEFGDHSAWISVAGYSIATLTGYMRVHNKRHYVGDVLAGAGIGILSARLAYWVAPRINKFLWGSVTGYDSTKYSAMLSPCMVGDSYGVNLSVTF